MRVRSRLVVAVVVMTLVGTALPGAPAKAYDGLFAGSCALTINVGYSSAVPRTPAVRSATVTGHGPCVVNGQLETGWYSAGIGSVAGLLTCEGGVMSGVGTFTTSAPGMRSFVIQTQIVRTGNVLEIAMQSSIALIGAGTFVEDPGATLGCGLSGSVSSATWTGAMAFEDPESPV